MKLNKLNQKKARLLTDRVFMLTTVIIGMFVVIIFQFYDLQIIEHDEYAEKLRGSVQREVEVNALRGIIYDRYGKPLATNKPIYVLKVDPEVIFSDSSQFNRVLLNVANLLEENGDTYIDDMPISKTVPFTFTENDQSVRSFITNYVPYDNQEHKLELYEKTADGLMDYLINDIYALDKSISLEDARKIIALRLRISQTSYQKYKKITIAENISMETLSAIEENQEDYPSILAELESQRHYTYGKPFGNLLGYTRTITASQYESMQELGYDKDDVVGQVGVESSMEQDLKGINGKELIEVDNVGRTVFTLETEEAVAGNDIYLTIDADLQVAIYEAIEKRLAQAIIERLKGTNPKANKLTGREVLISLGLSNQLDLKVMETAPERQMQRQLYDKVYASYELAKEELDEQQKELPEDERKTLTLKQHFADLLNSEEEIITNRELLLALAEQNSLKLDENLIQNIWNNTYPSVESIIISELESGELKPDQMAITPFSGTAVVIDVNTGETLALVGYPSYDSNDFVQNFNATYTKLNDNNDKRNVMINRALKTAKAPGSTFKMLVGIAGIEEGVIDKNTLINDTGVYTKAGQPYPRCWIYTNNGYGHGNENIVGALEVSCNYYFFDVAYRLGLKYGFPYGGIDALSQYVEMFGLSEKTGIELEESTPNISRPENRVTKYTRQAINGIKEMSEKSKIALKEKITEYIYRGFYMPGSASATDLGGRIDYLTYNDLKRLLDNELEMMLTQNFDTIYNKVLDDLREGIGESITDEADKVVEVVFSQDNETYLKTRTKNAIIEVLESYISNSTRKSINKALNEISRNTINQAFLSAYTDAYTHYKDQADMTEVVEELESRINLIKSGHFNGEEILVNKIIDRIISVYIDDFFKDIDMEWTTAVTIRTAIGQGENMFTPVQLARYIAGLANGKEVYDLKVVNGVYDNKVKDSYTETGVKLYNTLNIKESTLDAIYEGMLAVTTGNNGSARNYFKDFPVLVAGKTGTAEEVNEHSWFASFAPYDQPEIAVVTSMYDADGLGSYNIQLARDIFEIYFGINKNKEEVTLENRLVE